jgi:hypothetical protein
MVSLGAGAGVGAAVIDGFFACENNALGTGPGAALAAVVVGRATAEGRVDVDSDARGVVRAAALSAEGRVVRGRFAAAVAEAGGRVVEVVVFPGDDLVADVDARVVRRATGLLFSSPDVTEDRSGSASEAAALEANAGFRTTVPGAGRVGGLLKLDPAAEARVAVPGSVLDAVVAVRVVLVAAGRRAPVPEPTTAVGRRGGTASFGFEAILRRAGDEGVADGARARAGCWGASAEVVAGDSSPARSVATGGGGESMAAAGTRRAAAADRALQQKACATSRPVCRASLCTADGVFTSVAATPCAQHVGCSDPCRRPG